MKYATFSHFNFILFSTLLMASYLGHISQVAQLINEKKIHPDIADILGNTAVMYATVRILLYQLAMLIILALIFTLS